MRYAAHPMLAISFQNSKRIMLVTWLRHIEHCEKQLMFKDNQYHRTGRVAPSGTGAEV